MPAEQSSASAPLTARARAKAERRRDILAATARLMARHGFHGVRLNDIGAAVGVSGPAMYRHFASKDDALAELLLDISVRLRDGGVAVATSARPSGEVLSGLIALHVDFVVSEPDLISVHFRDLRNLPAEAQHRVRAVQREYVELWVVALRESRPELAENRARAQVQATFGLLNSSPRLADLADPATRELLVRMAQAALQA